MRGLGATIGIASVLAVLILGALAHPDAADAAPACTITWVGDVDNDWNGSQNFGQPTQNTNWSGNRFPNADDHACLENDAAPYTVRLLRDVTVDLYTIEAGVTLEIDGSDAFDRAALRADDNSTNAGTIRLLNRSSLATNSVQVPGATLTNTGRIENPAGGTVITEIAGNLDNEGTVSIESSVFHFTGTAGNSDPTVSNTGTLTLASSGQATSQIRLEQAGAGRIEGQGKLQVTGIGGKFRAVGGQSVIADSVEVSVGISGVGNGTPLEFVNAEGSTGKLRVSQFTKLLTDVPSGYTIDVRPISSGTELRVMRDVTNAGTISLSGGGAVVQSTDSFNTPASTLTNTGTIAFPPGGNAGTRTLWGYVVNRGTISVGHAEAVFGGRRGLNGNFFEAFPARSDQLTNAGTLHVAGGGTLKVSRGATLEQADGGSIDGSGTVNMNPTFDLAQQQCQETIHNGGSSLFRVVSGQSQIGPSVDVNLQHCSELEFVSADDATGNVDVAHRFRVDVPVSGNIPAGFSIDIDADQKLSVKGSVTNAGTINLTGAESRLKPWFTANNLLTNTGTIAVTDTGAAGIREMDADIQNNGTISIARDTYYCYRVRYITSGQSGPDSGDQCGANLRKLTNAGTMTIAGGAELRFGPDVQFDAPTASNRQSLVLDDGGQVTGAGKLTVTGNSALLQVSGGSIASSVDASLLRNADLSGVSEAGSTGHVVVDARSSQSGTTTDVSGTIPAGFSVDVQSGLDQFNYVLNARLIGKSDWTNAGTIRVVNWGAEVQTEFTGTLTNTGTLATAGSQGQNTRLLFGNLVNRGTIEVNANHFAIFRNEVHNTVDGEVNVAAGGQTGGDVVWKNAGTITVAGRLSGQGFTQTAGTTELVGGPQAEVASGQTMQVEGGTIKGNGTFGFNVNNTGGTVSPGATDSSAGTLNVSGNYTQAAGGTNEVDVTGTTPGTQFDQLVVASLVSLDGKLKVDTSGFTPAPTDKFRIIDAPPPPNGTTRSGTFASVEQTGYTHGVTYNPTNVVLEKKPECSDGTDNDGDGAVDHPADRGCTSPQDDSERTDENPECSDEIDNDADGQVDHPADSHCDSPADDAEDGPPQLSVYDQSAYEDQEQWLDLGNFADAGSGAPYTVTVDWGDGQTETFSGEPYFYYWWVGRYYLNWQPHTYASSDSDPSTPEVDPYTVRVTVTESDASPESGSETFRVDVSPPPPQANNDRYDFDADQAFSVDAPGVLANDSDPQGDPLTAEVTIPPSDGTVELRPDGSFTYTPNGGYSDGYDYFYYRACDPEGSCAETWADFVDRGPQANDDAASTDEDTPVPVDVLSNDFNYYGTGYLDPASVRVVTPPSHGVATVDSSTGQVTYAPAPDYNGADELSYEVCEGDPFLGAAPDAKCDTAKVSFEVAAANDPPVATDDAATTEQDSPVLIDVAANDRGGPADEAGQALGVEEITVSPDHGSAEVVAGGDDAGKVRYTPDPGYTGSDRFEYRVCDDGQPAQCATAAVDVTVTPAGAGNDAPSAQADSYATDEDRTLDIDAPGVLGNDSDPDGDSMRASRVDGPAHGTLSLDPDGSFTYTPDSNYHGADSFTYEACDDADPSACSAAVTVTLDVRSVNDAPAAADDAANTTEDEAKVVDVRANDGDPDGDSLTLASVSDPDHGTAQIEDGKVRYTPDADFHGDDSFTYTVGDGNGGSDTATVSVTVGSVNDAPVARDDAAATPEDQAKLVDVRANDGDPDGDSLTLASVSDPDHGSAEVEDGKVRYAPDADFHGDDSFTYRVEDGNGGSDTASVAVTVGSVNDAPDAGDDVAATNEDESTVVDVRANDGDPEGDQLTLASVSDPEHGSAQIEGGKVRYTPDANFHGDDSFTYRVEDGNGGSDTASVVVTVDGVNDAPVARDDEAATPEDQAKLVDVRANDGDPDGDSLTVASVSNPDHGSAEVEDGKVRYTPDADFHGDDSFTYTVGDGNGGSDTASVVVTVDGVNDAPLARDDEAATPEDQAKLVDVRANDGDPDGDPFTLASVSDPDHGSAQVEDGKVRYTPAADFHGDDSFTYRVEDGNGGSDTATVSVTVGSVNDAPVARDDEAATPEDQAKLVDVRANDGDPDGDPLTLASVSNPAHGSAEVEDGKVRYTPDADFHGDDSFTYRVEDGNGGSDTATVTMRVASVDDPPTISAIADQTVDSNSHTGELPFKVSDPDTPATNLVVSASSSDGTLVPPSGISLGGSGENRTIKVTPAPNRHGTATLTVKVSDGSGQATEPFDLTVRAPRDTTAPQIKCGSADDRWHNQDVAINCTATDAGSGLANPADASFLLSTSVPAGTETADAKTGTRVVCDQAGNCATAGPIGGNKVDKKAPAVTITTPRDGGEYGLDQNIAADYRCTDGGSGLASCAGPVANKSGIDTATNGAKSFRVEARDRAGNVASRTNRYTVVPVCETSKGLVYLDKDKANLDRRDGKVTFCHATSSATNPHNVITTSVSACKAHVGHLHQPKGGRADVFPTGGCRD
jgi:VCBS repeat-containing protein